MLIADARAAFAATNAWTYLDSAANTPLPDVSAQAGIDFLTDAQANGRSADLWQESLDRSRQGFARLIGAEAQDIVCTKNATEGVNIVAAGLDAEPGDNVVLCGALEHPANITPWLALQRDGVEVRLVPPDRQAIPPADIVAAMDARTRAVAVSTVSFMPGYRTDLAPIAEATRRMDALLVVDATQSAGVLADDVVAMGVGAYLTSTHKYLLGLYGQGFLYLNPTWAGRLKSAFVGAAGYREVGAHPAAEGFQWQEAEGARRFETGHAFASSAIVAASLDLLNAVGPAETEAHVTGLAAKLADGLAADDWPVNRDPYGQGQTQLVTLGDIGAGDLYAVGDPALARLSAALTEAKVRHSQRRGALRFAFHLFNNDADVATVLDVAQSVRRNL